MHLLCYVKVATFYVLLFKIKKMNIIMYTLNNWLLYLIYIHEVYLRDHDHRCAVELLS